ncbi:putative methyltransferase-like protein C27D7.08c [Tolypocladium ophioglossoides CBS 100239]|uniref:Putative methyltransferase-like protein C27D7.08c n=1 Tax=Tolypocladium ophioglossoides (strain CBS 100239) TaxID=1163406 RepID=A0A0L0NCW3_TOLOC|nr:putative methyltransferase-like protein C27D7.08c [Tolypocladium ophioglossoides CBS 100239]
MNPPSLSAVDPRPIASPSSMGPYPAAPPGSGITLQLGPESQIPDHPSSMVDVPRPMAQTMTPVAPTGPIDIRNVKASCQFGLREYLSLQRKRQRFDASTSTFDLESRLRAQANVVLGDLRTLQSEIRSLAKAAESHRWRRWLFGGVIATFIPAVRRIFRRGSDRESQSSSNDTEYAFRKSKGLMSRIKEGILGSERGVAARRQDDAEEDQEALFSFTEANPQHSPCPTSKSKFPRTKPNINHLDLANSSLSSGSKLLAMGPKRKAPVAVGEGDASPQTRDTPSRGADHARAYPDAHTTLEARDRRFRDLYSKPPDFKDLGRRDPDFAAVTKGRELDFCDPRSVVQLTKTLLKLDFGLQIALPDDRLCPPVTNRHNYILWLKRLLDTSSYSAPGQQLVGLDIGTGASCIYPLLGCAQRPWSFIATDIDAASLKWARRNVESNGLAHRINVVSRKPDDALIPLDDLGLDAIDFTMANPPFYKSEAELLQSAKQKSRPPFTACTGSKSEMVTEGGEVGFVNRILEESLLLRDRVQWYTSMVGFLSSVTHLVGTLREHGISNFAVTEFLQGNKTRRWAVGWSFGPMRPAQDVARGTKAAQSKNILPAATELATAVPMPKSIGEFVDRLGGAIGALDLISWDWDREALEGTGRAPDKVWARAWRRRKKRETEVQMEGANDPSTGVEPKCTFGFKVKMLVAMDHVSVCCRWVEGFDAVMLESFQGFLKAAARSAGSEDGPQAA